MGLVAILVVHHDEDRVITADQHLRLLLTHDQVFALFRIVRLAAEFLKKKSMSEQRGNRLNGHFPRFCKSVTRIAGSRQRCVSGNPPLVSHGSGVAVVASPVLPSAEGSDASRRPADRPAPYQGPQR